MSLNGKVERIRLLLKGILSIIVLVMEQITVVRGLTQLKNLDKKIQKVTYDAEFVSVRGEIRKPSENSKQAQRRFQQINDLISFRQKLKSALILSNATTKVKICGKEMTIAEVIEEKNAIKHKQELLRRLKDQYTRCVNEVEAVNQNLRRKLENETMNKNEKDDKTSIEEYQRGYMKLHQIELYDPISVKSQIDKLENYIDNFQAEVDHVLSESNATTKVEVPSLDKVLN